MKMRVMGWIFGLIVLLGSVTAALFIASTPSGPYCIDSIVAECIYPDGKTVATWFKREGEDGPVDFVLLRNAATPLEWNRDEIVFQHDSDPHMESDVVFIGDALESILWTTNEKLVVNYSGESFKKLTYSNETLMQFHEK